MNDVYLDRVGTRNFVISLRRLPFVLIVLSLLLCLNVSIVWASQNNEKMRNRAEKALRVGEFEVAVKLYREVLEKDSRDITARLGLSYAFYKQRNLLDAYDHAARAIAQDPLSPRAHSILGTVILASGDFRRSIEEFRTALSLNEDEALAIAGLGLVDFYENRLNDSISKLRRAAFIDPNEPDFIFSLGQTAARFERYKEAADAYERFLRVAPRTDADRRNRIRGLIDFLRYLGNQKSLYDISGDSQTKMSLDFPDGRPTVKIRINDRKEPLNFVLDTGSGMSVISNETAERLGIKAIARGGQARAVGGGGKFEIIYGFLQSLEIGNVRVGNVPVYIRKFYSAGKPVDGYLGIAAISSFVTTVDYKNKMLNLLRRRDANTVNVALGRPQSNDPNIVQPPLLTIPTRVTSSGFLSGEVKVQGIEEPLNFIIDTGASISVISNQLAQRDEMSQYAVDENIKLFGAAGVADNVPVVLLPKVALGSHVREAIRAIAVDLDSINETAGFEQKGILGTNFLNYFRVTFDFRGGFVVLEPNTQIEKKDETTNRVESETGNT
jgi:tetratricopeptide (TPR) repeat protein